MAITITTSALSKLVPLCGPFKSSASKYYVFGRDGTTATTLNVFKATDPGVSWSSVTTQTGYSTAILRMAAYQVGDIIHIAVADGTGTNPINYKYIQFDMSSDTFLNNETITSGLNITGTLQVKPEIDLCVRSGGEVVFIYQAAAVSARGRVSYNRRTGTNTYSGPTALDAGGTIDYQAFACTIGASDLIYFYWTNINVNQTITRTLDNTNTLGSTNTNANVKLDFLTNGDSVLFPRHAVNFNVAGTIKIAVLGEDASSNSIAQYNDSGGTLNTGTSETELGFGTSLIVDDTNDVIYAVATDSATGQIVSISPSTNFGSTWGTRVSLENVNSLNMVARGNIKAYTRVNGDLVAPVVYADNIAPATWLYTEYLISLAPAAPPPVPSVPVPQVVDNFNFGYNRRMGGD